MKKTIFSIMAALAVFAFISCDNGTSLEEDTNTDTPQETPVETPAETPKEETKVEEPAAEEEEDLGYTTPVLPSSVGEDPFKGKTYIDSSNYDIYKFGSDGTVLHQINSENIIEDMEKYNYTYNSQTQVMNLALIAKREDIDVDEPHLWTFLENKNYYLSFNYEDYADILTEEEFNEEITDVINNLKKKFESMETWGVVESGNTIEISETYYVSLPESFLDSGLQLTSTETDTYNNQIQADFEKNKIKITKAANHTDYSITSMTSNRISAKLNDDDVITLSYTATVENGFIVLSITGADEESNSKLTVIKDESGNPIYNYTLKNRQYKEIYTLVTD
ncbi:MAG: hypothetical protein K5786_08710 [Treponema sp.]|nr:hypothetical protein [Treponema sp.]